MDLIQKYFPEISSEHLEKLSELRSVFLEWNEKVNLISRKDTDSFEEKHVLHALLMSKFLNLSGNEKILDIGTGGGIPGLPLAIIYPDVKFVLVDSIRKKTNAVSDMVKKLNLPNVDVVNDRVENLQDKFDVIMSRAVAPAPKLMNWTKKLRKKDGKGYFFLKGGDLQSELATIHQKHYIYPLFEKCNLEFYETKKLVHIQFA